MRPRVPKIFRFPVYPLLIAYFPLFSIYTHNFPTVPFISTLAASAVVLATAVVLWFLSSVWLKNRTVAALLTSLIMLLFLTYGHIYSFLQEAVNFESNFPANKIVAAGQALVVLAAFWLLKFKSTPETTAKIGKVVTAVAIALYIYPVAALALEAQASTPAHIQHTPSARQISSAEKSEAAYPDIYYLLLDGYGREDMLRQNLGFDNGDFIHALEARDFYVAGASCSNYSQTILSLTSSLNLNYLQRLYNSQGIEDERALANAFQENEVLAVLRQHGYYTVSTASGFDFTKAKAQLQLSPAFALNDFESTVLSLTPIPSLLNNALLKIFVSQHAGFFDLYEAHRERIRYAFSVLGAITKPADKPVFVFSHILLAHPPFVFDAAGHPTSDNAVFSLSQPAYGNSESYRQHYARAYQQQVIYGNKLLLQAVDNIIRQDGRKKVIIVQGDHGPFSAPLGSNVSEDLYKERMSILNAYYFSDGGPRAMLYKSISPVNSFRVVFNHYLATDYTILEDRSYFTPYEDIFHFEEVTNLVN